MRSYSSLAMGQAALYLAVSILMCLHSAGGATEDPLEEAANCFTLRLYKELASDRNNLVSSPFGAYLLFSMLLVGAGGRTAEELKQALGYSDMSITEMQEAFQAKLGTLCYSGKNTLTIANALWIQRSFTLSKKYTTVAREKFFSDVFSVDFEEAAGKAKDKMNSWVNEKTHGLISRLFDQELDTTTLMVLTNAMYFKGQWAEKFDKRKTRLGTFFNHGSHVDTSEVEMMSQQSKYNYKYVPSLNAEVLEMDYSGRNLSMLILLPARETKFEGFEQALTCDLFLRVLRSGTPTTVDVNVPVFEVSSEFYLQSALWQMGIQRAFDMSANFSGIGKNMYVSKAVQKAVFAVSEEGSEGASVTAAVAGKRTASQAPDFVCFRAERPFVFLVRDKPSGLVLFMGRVTELPPSV